MTYAAEISGNLGWRRGGPIQKFQVPVEQACSHTTDWERLKFYGGGNSYMVSVLR